MNKAVLGTKESLSVHVLFRFSAKTGQIDTTITGLGNAMLRMWAMNNTTKTKQTLIFNRDTGELIFAVNGKTGGIKSRTMDGDLGTCEDFGISLEDLQDIKDDRFDD